MTSWERLIVDAFLERFPSSAAGSGGRALRVKAEKIFPGFDTAPLDDRESFLDAAESLEKRGIVSLVWKRHLKHESLLAVVFSGEDALFEAAGKRSPAVIAKDAREAAEAARDVPPECRAFFSFLAANISAEDAAKGIDSRAVEHLVALCKRDTGVAAPATRALSVALYADSKRLETLLKLFSAIAKRAERRGIPVPDFSSLARAFPETLIAGNITLFFKDDSPALTISSAPTGLPLVTVKRIARIRAENGGLPSPKVLCVENKETFFSLCARSDFECVLYIGGHPNQAVCALLSLLADAGFIFFHAGDLDPDGILIMHEVSRAAKKPVIPFKMDCATFDRYAQFGKKLSPSILKRLSHNADIMREIPEITELAARIERTGIGIEQEIIDYS